MLCCLLFEHTLFHVVVFSVIQMWSCVNLDVSLQQLKESFFSVLLNSPSESAFISDAVILLFAMHKPDFPF